MLRGVGGVSDVIESNFDVRPNNIHEVRKALHMSGERVFEVILADPPWRYSFSRSPTRKIENHYPTMTVAQIKRLGKAFPMAKNSVLFLWSTAPKLLQALEIMKAWGFDYRTQAVWDKRIMGMGYWFRSQHEILLVGTKGKFSPPNPSHRIPSMISRTRDKHSRKPEDVHLWIERAFPTARKLELFARRPRAGWTVWGNEVESTITLKHVQERSV